MKHPDYPAAAGQWTIEGDRLRCRLPRKTIEVDAPSEFLGALSLACDGSRDWHTAIRSASGQWPPEAVASAIGSLVEGGAIVDATQQVASTARIGWIPLSPNGRLPGADGTVKSGAAQAFLFDPAPAGARHPRPSPLLDSIAARRTPTTFGSAALDAQAIVDILWAMHGVTAGTGRRGVRRTVPSGGGLYAIDWYLALLRGNAEEPAGLYKVGHHAVPGRAGRVSLVALPGLATSAWRTLLTPAILAHATALVFPVARLDAIAALCGNRALTYALIELGHACQNGALAALAIGAASSVRGDTIETEVQRLFALDDSHYPMPAWTFGSAPDRDEAECARRAERRLRIAIVPQDARRLDLPSTLATAGPIRIGRRPPVDVWASGRDADPRLAVIKAEAEAWERIGWSTPKIHVRAAMAELPTAVDPRRLCLYSDTQHRRPGFPFVRWSTRREVAWVEGLHLASGAPAHVPAQCVHSLGSLRTGDAAHPITNASTSGMAAWSSREGAIERALVEALERDAFARAWLAQRPLPVLDHRSLGVSLRQRIDWLARAGYDVQIRRLPSCWLPCALVMARRASHSFACAATGAGFTVEDAVDRALLESETKIQDAHEKPPMADFDPRKAGGTRAHGHWFRTARGWRDADALLAVPPSSPPAPASAPSARCTEDLVRAMAAAGFDVIACDLTPSGASLGQGRTALSVWRVLLPGLLPLWFGHGLEPLGSAAAARIPVDRAALRRRPLHPCT